MWPYSRRKQRHQTNSRHFNMDNELQALRTLLCMLADVVHFIMVIILLSKRPATVPVSSAICPSWSAGFGWRWEEPVPGRIIYQWRNVRKLRSALICLGERPHLRVWTSQQLLSLALRNESLRPPAMFRFGSANINCLTPPRLAAHGELLVGALGWSSRSKALGRS